MGEVVGESPSDAELIGRSRDDPEAFSPVFERHVVVVHRYLARRSPQSVVDDLVAETFITAFRRRARYDAAYPDARPWLLGIATNVLRHQRRAEGRRLARLRRVEPMSPEPDPADRVVGDVALRDESARISAALAQLDEHQRDVLWLVAGPGLSYEEVARALDLPVGTVRSRLSRGRRRLRELLGLDGQYDDSGAARVAAATEEATE